MPATATTCTGGIRWSGPNPEGPLLFHEYFHGDNGAGIGASHQTGWTGAVARLIQLFGSTGPAEMLHGPPLPLAHADQPPGASPAAPGPAGDGARSAGTTAV